jgi:hypothetical protein
MLSNDPFIWLFLQVMLEEMKAKTQQPTEGMI